MSFNLFVARSDVLNCYVAQKCLLPSCCFSNSLRPGQWAKCYFMNAGEKDKVENFAVCQIFPREEYETMCFLDTSVCHSKVGVNKQLILDRVTPLNIDEIELEEVNVTFFLNAEYFMAHMEEMSLTMLVKTAHTLLQSFNLCSMCTISSSVLQERGVDFLMFKVIGGRENESFIITDKTRIHTDKVFLTPSKTKNEVLIDLRPQQEARQQLNCLVKFVQMQKESNISMNSNRNALIVGPEGCGKTNLLESFLKEAMFNVFRVVPSDVIRQYPGETEEILRQTFKAAKKLGQLINESDYVAIVLEDIHILCPSLKGSKGNTESDAYSARVMGQLLSLIDDLSRTESRIFCLATTNNSEALNDLLKRPGRFEREISINALNELDRKLAVKQYLEQNLININVTSNLLETVSKHTQGYSIGDIVLLCRKVVQLCLLKTPGDVEAFMKECLKTNKSTSLLLSDIRAIRLYNNFSMIGGMDATKKKLETSILIGLTRRESFSRFGLSMPKGVLLYGPPGCAKTTIAKCLATEANMTFIATSAAEVYSPYVGCAEAFIAKIFNTARKNAPCLIFLDEIDSLVGRRGRGSSTSNDVQTRILSTLLTEMDGIISSSNAVKDNSHILVVAATNRPDMVDDALMRPGRFDKLIHVPAPDFLSRLSILRLYQQSMPFNASVDVNKIAECTENFSGADICNICNEAAMEALNNNLNAVDISVDDFNKVLQVAKSSLTNEQINRYYQFENTVESH